MSSNAKPVKKDGNFDKRLSAEAKKAAAAADADGKITHLRPVRAKSRAKSAGSDEGFESMDEDIGASPNSQELIAAAQAAVANNKTCEN